MAHQPGASAKQRQGGRPREETRPQAQKEPRGEEERGDDHGVPKRLRRQRRYASGWDGGGGGCNIFHCRSRVLPLIFYSPPLHCFAEGPKRGPVQWHSVEVQFVGHAELWRRGGRGERRLCASASAYGHPAAQPAAARVAGWQGEEEGWRWWLAAGGVTVQESYQSAAWKINIKLVYLFTPKYYLDRKMFYFLDIHQRRKDKCCNFSVN